MAIWSLKAEYLKPVKPISVGHALVKIVKTNALLPGLTNGWYGNYLPWQYVAKGR
jgi:hypothetical protein